MCFSDANLNCMRCCNYLKPYRVLHFMQSPSKESKLIYLDWLFESMNAHYLLIWPLGTSYRSLQIKHKPDEATYWFSSFVTSFMEDHYTIYCIVTLMQSVAFVQQISCQKLFTQRIWSEHLKQRPQLHHSCSYQLRSLAVCPGQLFIFWNLRFLFYSSRFLFYSSLIFLLLFEIEIITPQMLN